MRSSLLLLGLALVPGFALAEEEGDDLLEELEEQARRIEVIQKRKYEALHEVTLLLGGLPSDPYYYGLTGTLGYTYHFTQSAAWELGQFTYSYNRDKKLKERLYTTALGSGMQPPELPAIDWIVASHFVLKPLYGKEAIFNTEVLHLEAFLQAGPAVVHTTDAVRTYAFGMDLGAGLRFWLSEALSLRVDIGELVYWMPQTGGKEREVKGALELKLGLAFNLRGED